MKIHRMTWTLLLLSGAALAQQDISGTWAGVLAVAPDTNLNVHFVLTRQADGAYSAVLTSPDPNGIKDVAVDSVSFDSNHLMMSVDALSGSYDGMLADGEITGEWKQQDTSIPLNLAPYEEPVLTQAEIDTLTGSWTGPLNTPAGSLSIVFQFETGDDGEFAGFVSAPEQGGGRAKMSVIQLAEDGGLLIRVDQAGLEFPGTLDGDQIVGTWKQGGQSLPITLSRGEYQAPDVSAGLSDADKQRLEGSWVGKVSSPRGELTIVFRFETGDDGHFAGYLDSPDQGARGIPMSELAVADGTLSVKVARAQLEYSAPLGDTEMSGTWKQAGGEQTVTLTKGTYTPGTALELSAEAMEQLAGAWSGELGPLTVTIRFQTNAAGSPVGFLDVPAQGVMDVPVTSASLADGNLTLAITGLGVQYTGSLSGAEITGTWNQGPGSNPLTLTRQ